MEDYEQIYQFLSGRYPAGFSKNQKRALRRKSKNFEVNAGYLYYCKGQSRVASLNDEALQLSSLLSPLCFTQLAIS